MSHLRYNRDGSLTYSFTFKARWTSIPLKQQKLERQKPDYVVTNLKQTEINRGNYDLLWLPQLLGSQVHPEGQSKDNDKNINR